VGNTNNIATKIKSKKQFIAFLIVGSINTIFGYGLFWVFVTLGLHYSLAILIGSILGVVFNFKTTGSIVFKNKDNSLIAKYLIVYAIQYIFNVGGIKLLSFIVKDSRISGGIMILPAAAIVYLMLKSFVFKSSKAAK